MWYRNLECLLNLWFTTFQVCYFSSMLRRRNERGKCKQQTIEVIQLCLSCVLLFLIDFQTHVFGYHIQTRCSLPRYQGASMWPKCGHAIGLSLDELLMSLRNTNKRCLFDYKQITYNRITYLVLYIRRAPVEGKELQVLVFETLQMALWDKYEWNLSWTALLLWSCSSGVC